MNALSAKLAPLIERFNVWYAGLQERERRTVLIGAAAVGALLLIGGIALPLHAAVSSATQRAAARREDLAWMQANAQVIRAGNALRPIDTGEAPVVVVNRVGREAGLATALRRTQPSGTGVSVQLESAAFDTLLAWLATLDERYGMAVESIKVDRAARPGVVDATITFAAPRR